MGGEWIVVLGGPPVWGDCGSQAARMAHAFWSLGYKVLYIECERGRGCQKARPPRREDKGQTVFADLDRRNFFAMPASRVPCFPVASPEFVRQWNSNRTSVRAARFLASAGAGHVIVCHYSWYFPDLFKTVRESVIHVYECTDDHAAAPDVASRLLLQRHVLRTERRLLSRAALTVFSSPELADARGPLARATALLPMGVDAAHFLLHNTTDPHEKRGLSAKSPARPRIGFLGRVTDRFDWALVRAAASTTPEWDWVIIGPIDRVRPKGPPNLHWLGPVQYRDIPQWMAHWDVGLAPYAAIEFNQRVCPMKLLEYMASGLPIVSTAVPAAFSIAERLPGQVFVAADQTAASLVLAVRRALLVPAWKREACRSFAKRHTWESRARSVLDLLEKQLALA